MKPYIREKSYIDIDGGGEGTIVCSKQYRNDSN